MVMACAGERWGCGGRAQGKDEGGRARERKRGRTRHSKTDCLKIITNLERERERAEAMSGAIICSLLPSLRMPSVIVKTNRARITPCKTVQRRSTKITAEVNFINGEEAKKLVEEEGYVVLDVRDKTQYDRAHIKSCYHVPLFIENKDNDLSTIIKRTVHNNFSGLFFGLSFTKLNPDFVKLVKEQFSTDSKLLLVCQEGLRSTAATNKLEEEGFQNLSCITSGLQSVKPGTFNSEGSSELQNAGKAGLVTVQGKISAVLGTVLICAFLFITFFPEQAEKLLQMSPVG